MPNKKTFIWILSIIIFFGNIQASKAEIINKDVLPPDILPVIFLSGSDYEMGYQYGQQAGNYIKINKESCMGFST